VLFDEREMEISDTKTKENSNWERPPSEGKQSASCVCRVSRESLPLFKILSLFLHPHLFSSSAQPSLFYYRTATEGGSSLVIYNKLCVRVR